MREEHDAMMLVRADLCDRLEMMQAFLERACWRDFAEAVGTFRSVAKAYGLHPVVRLAEALERAIAESAPRRFDSCPTALYLDRLQDAIGCERLDEATSQAIIASVSVRLSA